jgi:hypothetical protein
MPRELTLPAPDGHTYQIGTLDAMQQWAIAKRFINQANSRKEAWERENDNSDNSKTFREPSLESLLSGMSDEDSQTVIHTALRAVTRRGEQGGWFPVMTQGTNKMQFADMKMEALIALTFAVMRDNIDSFFTTEQPDSTVPKTA